MAKMIVLMNLKGGVGKSTFCMLYGSHLYSIGKRVLVIENDVQQTISNERKYESDQAGFDLEYLPSSDPRDIDRVLGRVTNKYDFILIDTHGGIGSGDKGYLIGKANLLIVPFQPKIKDIETTLNFLAGSQELRKGITTVGLVNTSRKSPVVDKMINDMDGQYNLKMLRSRLSRYVVYENASTHSPVINQETKALWKELTKYLK